MGAKTQPSAKDSNVRRPPFRCDECERNFQTLAAFKSHFAKHPEKHKQLNNDIESKEEKKTAFVPPTSRVSKRLQQKKSVDSEIISTPSQPSSKTVFQCPKCLKEFGVFFPAQRHIKNRHCVDKEGNPVSPNSLDLIQPIRKEVCTMCDKVHGSQHCGDISNEGSHNGMYCCLACKQTFLTVTSFDEHVEESHDDSVTVIILENMKEFQNWKSNLEAKQRVKYLTLSNTAQKLYYQCNYVSPQNSADITHLCPSVIIARELSKEIHVRYYKDHHEHTCENYIHQPKIKNASPEDNDDNVFEDIVKSGVDVYIKINDIMKSITQKAATLKKAKLKPLYLLALEMQLYINSLKDENEDEDEPTLSKKHIISNSDEKTVIDDDGQDELSEKSKSSKNMTDDQILKALEGTRALTRSKRKNGESPAPEPKKKLLKKSETNAGLKENNSPIDLVCSERFESPKPNIPSPFSQSPSFNDSYKQFIDSTSPKVENDMNITKKVVKKEVVKTRIGQFTPSPKKAKVPFESENVTSKKKKKTLVKTTPLKDVKLEDVEYEVVEQENDCNILILKI